eukprot:336224_1
MAMFQSSSSISMHKRFIESLRCVGFNGDIVLAVYKSTINNQEHQTLWNHYNVTAIDWDVIRNNICNDSESSIALKYLICVVRRGVPPLSISRYAFYKYIVDGYDNKSRVLLIDFRDSFFQSNLFSADVMYEDYELFVFAEWAIHKLGYWDFDIVHKDNFTGDPGINYNTLWVKNCFGLKEGKDP